MSFGHKRLIFNPRERGVSSDVNRLQAFFSAAMSEQFRFQQEGLLNDNQGAGGVPTFNASGTTTPLDAQVAQGFLVRPQPASTGTTVDAGVMYAIFPDASPSPDDSPYKYVADPGVTNAATLLLTPNSSGSTRIDVVECQPSEVVLETTNRDQYQQSSGTFSPVTVQKVSQKQLAYRVRAGTPGGGLALAAGWLPLMVASVPNGTTTWDQCLCWDVRPLMSDANVPGYRMSFPRPRVGRREYFITPAQTKVKGIVEVSSPGWWRAGGVLAKGSFVTNEYVDLTDAAVQEQGFALIASTPFYLYAAFPGGLPRWARYVDAPTTPRVPNGMRGVAVVSTTVPLRDGYANVPIALPSGLGSTTTAVVLLGAIATSGAAFPSHFFCDGVRHSQTDQPSIAPFSVVLAPTVDAKWIFSDGVTHPPNARALWVDFFFKLAGSGSPTLGPYSWQVRVFDRDNTNSLVVAEGTKTYAGDTGFTDIVNARIPIDNAYDATSGGLRSIRAELVVDATGSSTVLYVGSSASAKVRGWEWT